MNLRQHLFNLHRLAENMARYHCADVAAAAALLGRARRTGACVFTCGNGGSASTADHFACDLMKNAGGFKAIALTGQTATLTALANDIDYTATFVRQLEALAEANDILVAISASGNSPNILAALRMAGEWGMWTIGLLGFDGGKAKRLCDVAVVVRSDNYGLVEDMHMAICHALTAHFREDG